jgi:cobalt-zinc-cadmium efflux system outer membrane protein
MYFFTCIRGINARHARYCVFLLLALSGCLVAALLAAPTSAANSQSSAMTLPSAVQLALSRNPELQVYQLREQGLRGLATTANLSPQFAVGAEAENLGGSGDFNGTDSAEFTLALSSVIELGGKREARVAAVNAQRALIDAERQARALDLMGEVTRRFVDAVANQARLELALKSRSLAQDTVQAVQRRTRSGAAPEAELYRARAQLAQAQLAVDEAQNRLQVSAVSLAVMWGDTEPDFVRVSGDLLNLGVTGDFNALFQRAIENPAIAVFASEERVRAAELQLAKTQASADIDWSIGVRQFQDTDDTALVAGLSIPLNTSGRNAGALVTARAARDEVAIEREAALLSVRASLFDAFQQRRQGIETAHALRADVIPALATALQQTRAAYESGRYGYQEWVAARQELLAAEHDLIAAASAALHSGATIEQLTAEPLLPALDPEPGATEQESN